jgi:hypothetical protein
MMSAKDVDHYTSYAQKFEPCLVSSAEVVLGQLGVSLHGLGTGLPSAGDDLTVLLVVLEGLKEAEGLVDVAAHGKIVNSDLAEVLLGVNDEDAAEGDTVVLTLLNENSVVLGDLLGEIGQDGDVHLAKATLLALLVGPGQVRELAVDGGSDDLATEVLELLSAVGVLDDLRGANEGEVERVEEQDNPLSLVVGQADRLEGAVGHQRISGELRSGLADDSLGHRGCDNFLREGKEGEGVRKRHFPF